MWPNPQKTSDLVTFTEEILNRKLHFLCSGHEKGELSSKGWGNFIAISKWWTKVKPKDDGCSNLTVFYEKCRKTVWKVWSNFWALYFTKGIYSQEDMINVSFQS